MFSEDSIRLYLKSNKTKLAMSNKQGKLKLLCTIFFRVRRSVSNGNIIAVAARAGERGVQPPLRRGARALGGPGRAPEVGEKRRKKEKEKKREKKKKKNKEKKRKKRKKEEK